MCEVFLLQLILIGTDCTSSLFLLSSFRRRCFSVLGFDEYIESLADGLQVLRYNKTTAYIPHLDWIDDDFKREEHDFESLGVGSNRFATILLYMSDLKETSGGETVFSLVCEFHVLSRIFLSFCFVH